MLKGITGSIETLEKEVKFWRERCYTLEIPLRAIITSYYVKKHINGDVLVLEKHLEKALESVPEEIKFELETIAKSVSKS